MRLLVFCHLSAYDMGMKVQHLFRHPVKGFQPESLDKIILKDTAGVEGDRIFAFQFLDQNVPQELQDISPDATPWMSKFHLAMQHDWPALAQIVPTWNSQNEMLRLQIHSPHSGNKTMEASTNSADGRKELSDFVYSFLQKQTPFANAKRKQISKMRLIGSSKEDVHFTDGQKGLVSVGLWESLKDLEITFQTMIDFRRFRLNIILNGVPAWSELEWSGKMLRIGETKLRVLKPIGRCANIDVNPENGLREVEIFPSYKERVGHSFFGLRCEVLKAGTILKNDTWELWAGSANNGF